MHRQPATTGLNSIVSEFGLAVITKCIEAYLNKLLLANFKSLCMIHHRLAKIHDFYSFIHVYVGIISGPLEDNGKFEFTYQVGDNISYTQNPEIVRNLPDLSFREDDNSSHVTLYGVKAGSIIVGIDSSSTQFKK